MANLSDPVSRIPLSAELRRKACDAIWGIGCNPKLDMLQPYFTYYEDQCSHSQLVAWNHQDVIRAIKYLGDQDATVQLVEQRLRHASSVTRSEGTLENLVILAARLRLMIHVGNISQAFTPGSAQIRWKGGGLGELTRTVFSQRLSPQPLVRFEKVFNAYNLERIAGIRVSWTSNLADHLSMKDDDSRVMIFHHATFLELIRDSRHQHFPPGLVEETLRTLSLLLPPNHGSTSRWFRKKQKRYLLDPKAGACGHLNTAARQIDSFAYWHDRLVILKQAFDDSEPKTLAQWWNDDRKRVQWYTFWIAALILFLTIVFGLIQSITGIIQAWATVKGLA